MEYVIKSPHQLDIDKVCALLKSDSEHGLSELEAISRLRKYGKNALVEPKKRSLIRIFIGQFTNALVAVLAIAAAVAFVFEEWLEGSAILVVILINAIIGYYMEVQAIKSMDALRKLTRSFTRAIRDGHLQQVSVEELVPGDVVFLEAGDMVPADCRLTEFQQLGVSEAILTGESDLIEKTIDPIDGQPLLAETFNMIYKGTMISRGNAHALVVGTGRNTQLGRIADLTAEAEKESTPLEKKLTILSKKLIGITLILAAGVMIIGLIQGRGLYLMIETAIALAIAAIPEGLPIVATIALARGMLRLARYQVIVKKLSAVETLGETQVILTDKTGTLTENRLSPEVLVTYAGDSFIDHLQLNNNEKSKEDHVILERILEVGVLCNNASLKTESDEDDVGDPLEVALLRLADEKHEDYLSLYQKFPRIKEIPFDSDIKMMGTMHEYHNDDYLVCVKGAVEVVLKESDYVLTANGLVPLKEISYWSQKADALSEKGIRVLAMAYATIDEVVDDFSHNLVLLGLIGFMDPPRKEIKEAIDTCHKAGIEVVMVTGDHPKTAVNIAREVNLMNEHDGPAIHGSKLDLEHKLSDEERAQLIRTSVFARVSPAQKLKLVNLYQSMGQTVGMIGDGVNDTPALKKSDIGIAMGKRGTEAAKEVADLVLKDDAFTSIVVAIRQGRGILENIRYFVIYLLSCNLSEILLVASAFFTNLPMPLLPLQILFINMVTDVFPAFALGTCRESESVMQQSPRKKGAPIITREGWKSIVVYALFITMASIGALLYASLYLELDAVLANNFAFYTLILAQLWQVFNLTDINQSFFNNIITRNKYIWSALFLSIVIVVVAYFVPVLKEVLSLGNFTWEYLGLVIGFSLLPVASIQITKRLKLIE